MYLNSFNYFRGIAIVFIVAGHCLYMSGWAIDSSFEKWVANLVLGGTFFFVFISGFLFHHIYASRFQYGKFIKTKIKNVLLPYLILSGPYVFYSVLIKHSGPFAEYIFTPDPGIYHAYIKPIMLYLWTGRILTAYWYIPFIMVVFFLSPLIMAFIRLRPAFQIWIIFFLSLVSITVQRPVLNLFVWQSFFYFLPVYLFGVVVSIHRKIFYEKCAGREIYLLIAISLLAMIQSLYYPFFGNFHKPPFQFSWPDLLFIQKILLCVFFMALLNRMERYSMSILDTLASASFAIFFIHPYLLWGVQVIMNQNIPFLMEINGPVLWLSMTLLVILVSIGLARCIRYVFKSYSRMIIGW